MHLYISKYIGNRKMQDIIDIIFYKIAFNFEEIGFIM